ncbi:TonB-dependent receptor [Thalassotalea sp. LPB0316]|uniref:TonB-dependent receptor domain-containing protein n=1 Tax=Thalassotalea sp. LPB0316 TaxID=2769490 RepID=UPI0018672620|nr:TonB-dependent receptor [Thalassotalea sp. LPB0316]QOL25934.1 TonB-dependent receptor [Thalassotalea sp. LPB0316]
MNYQNNKSRSILLSPIALAVTTLLSTPAMADDEIITVTASRSDNPLIEQLANQVVISQADIAKIQPKSMSELLSTVAGIDISSQGGRGQNASLYLRGANASHTLFLINGMRVNSASLGLTDIQTIAPELIERIEIIKGPRAAFWGSDAIGGVVNIFTRELKQGEGYVGGSLGADSYRQVKAGIGFSHGDGHSSLSFNHEQSEGFDVFQGVQDDNDGYEYDTLVYRGQQQLTTDLTLEWLAQATQGENEFDNAWGADQTDIKQHLWYVKSGYNWQVGHVQNTLNVTLGQNRDYAKNFGNGVEKNDGNYFETRRDQLSIVNNAQVWPHFQVNFGADFYQESLASTTEFTISARDIYGVFAQGLYQKDSLTFELAMRYDDIEHVDSETTYNAGVAYQLTQSSKVTLNLGTGFKAPTFNDLYWPADPYSSGNPDLVPETSQTAELIYTTGIKQFDLSASIFSSTIDNLIDWQPDENYFYQPVNVNEVDINGVEFTARYQGFGGSHQLNASYIDTEDKATGEQLARRAKELIGYQFQTSVAGIDLFVDYQFNGKREEGAVTLDSYHLVNLSANYALSSTLSAQVKLLNVLDEEYQTAVNYNTQDRALYLGLTYQM